MAGNTYCQRNSVDAFGYFRDQRPRNVDATAATSQIARMRHAYFVQMLPQPRFGGGWQHRDPILVALAATDEDLMIAEINVLYAQLQAFQYPHASTVKEHRHQLGHAVHLTY
jgi:hypothetical protein